MPTHPELDAEQAYIDHAYVCLEDMRAAARNLRSAMAVARGGTPQSFYERDVMTEAALARLERLQLGSESLVFGRIDREDEERFYIGRLAVHDDEQSPVVVDWRAPVAEAFYRATGRAPLGLTLRRHFATDGQRLVGIEDESFAVDGSESPALVGPGALLASLERSRSGHMRDIVATIQVEQDEVIRADLPGVLVVQGGPGTGKTAVALHRASYLLYTHRFPLERQGVLVVGPTRLFMRYIDRVLPSLGESGVELRALDGLLDDVDVRGTDTPAAALVKGDARMARVLWRAVRDRQRPLRDDLVVPFGVVTLRLSSAESAELVQSVKRMRRVHNAGRRQLQLVVMDRLYHRYGEALQRTGRGADGTIGLALAAFSGAMRREAAVRAALERMWPMLTPQDLLRDLFGAPPLVRLAAGGILDDGEQAALHRDREESVEEVAWTAADVPLLDEAALLLGSADRRQPDQSPRTYGHIVIDEAQDLSPMQLAMISRRSLAGSMTVVGDIAQASSVWGASSWEDVLAHLPVRRPSRVAELTIGYRTPGEIMDLAARVLARAAPQLRPPRSVRRGDGPPRFVPAAGELGGALVRTVTVLSGELGEGTVAVIAADSMVDAVAGALRDAGVPFGQGDLDSRVSVLTVGAAKGLEFDGVVVVEPARMIREAPQGLRALYVAMTRATRRLAIVHDEPLPDVLQHHP